MDEGVGGSIRMEIHVGLKPFSLFDVVRSRTFEYETGVCFLCGGLAMRAELVNGLA